MSEIAYCPVCMCQRECNVIADTAGWTWVCQTCHAIVDDEYEDGYLEYFEQEDEDD